MDANEIYKVAFSGDEKPYYFLPFRFKKKNNKYLLVNDLGDYIWLDANDFHALINYRIDKNSSIYKDLITRFFVIDDDSHGNIEQIVIRYRTKKAFLLSFTKLHIFVLTLRCNLRCTYCQVSRKNIDANKQKYDMNEEIARKSVDLMFKSNAKDISVEVQGGEPLLNFDILKFIVEYSKKQNRLYNKNIHYTLVTNLYEIEEEIITFLKHNNFYVSVSIDGPSFLHNLNRRAPNGDSYERLKINLENLIGELGAEHIAGLLTVTRSHLHYPKEVIDEYVQLGLNSIFIRPLNTFGFAKNILESIHYSVEEFLSFYKGAIQYIVSLNKSGIRFVERYSQILLHSILTPFASSFVDLSSPCGAGIGQIVYNYNGDVFTCDEGRMLGEMGDYTFRLGNVLQNSYDEIFLSDKLQIICMSSCNECLPGCSDCVYQPYCGVCPVYNYYTQGSIFGNFSTNNRCKLHEGLFDYFFDLLDSSSAPILESFVKF